MVVNPDTFEGITLDKQKIDHTNEGIAVDNQQIKVAIHETLRITMK